MSSQLWKVPGGLILEYFFFFTISVSKSEHFTFKADLCVLSSHYLQCCWGMAFSTLSKNGIPSSRIKKKHWEKTLAYNQKRIEGMRKEIIKTGKQKRQGHYHPRKLQYWYFPPSLSTDDTFEQKQVWKSEANHAGSPWLPFFAEAFGCVDKERAVGVLFFDFSKTKRGMTTLVHGSRRMHPKAQR